jgi:hypothetical protein
MYVVQRKRMATAGAYHQSMAAAAQQGQLCKNV